MVELPIPTQALPVNTGENGSTPIDPIAHARSMIHELYPDESNWNIIRKPTPEPVGKPTADTKKPARSWLHRLSKNIPKQQHQETQKQADPNHPRRIIFTLTSDTNDKPRDITYEKLLQIYESKKKAAIKTRAEQEHHLDYLAAKTTGKTGKDAGYVLSSNNILDEDPDVLIHKSDPHDPPTRLGSYKTVCETIEHTAYSFPTIITNLTRAYGSRTKALETYISYETRLGTAARYAFDKQKEKLARQSQSLAALEKHPDAKTWRAKMRTLSAHIAAQATKPIWYAQALFAATGTTILYEYNPLRMLGEQTLGKLWTIGLPYPGAIGNTIAKTLADNPYTPLSRLAKKSSL